MLDIAGITKTFPGQVALSDVSLRLQPGEIHALVGQNGSGKSTLIKILAGYHRPDPDGRATIMLDGESVSLDDADSPISTAVRFVHQDLGLVDTLSASENIGLGLGFVRGFAGRIRWSQEHRRAAEVRDALGFRFDVRVPVGELTVAERTEVAIVRALTSVRNRGVRVLVLDEPTAALGAADAGRLFSAARRMRDSGMAVLFVSHHLGEVLEVCDRATVLRDGRVVAVTPTAGLTKHRLVELIVGRAVETSVREKSVDDRGYARLRTTGLRGGNLRWLDLSVQPGEIVGIAGLEGSGREDVASLLVGACARDGSVAVDGTDVAPDERKAIAAGMALVPADRARKGVIAGLSVRENLTLMDVGSNTRRGRLIHAAEKAETNRWIDRLGVVTTGSEAVISTLSGGNQQKVLIARALRLQPAVLVLDNPTQGVDIAAKADIHALVASAAASGKSVVVCSTDNEELAAMCDRVLVLRGGHVVSTLRRGGDLTPDRINHDQLLDIAS